MHPDNAYKINKGRIKCAGGEHQAHSYISHNYTNAILEWAFLSESLRWPRRALKVKIELQMEGNLNAAGLDVFVIKVFSLALQCVG